MKNHQPPSKIPSNLQPYLHFMGDHFETAVHAALVAIPIGALVGCAVAAYDYVVNSLLWDRFATKVSPEQLCLVPIAGMIVTGLILRLFRVKSSAMADDIVRAYHHPSEGLDYGTVLPKLGASIATIGMGCSAGMEGASKWLGGSIAAAVQSGLNRLKPVKFLHSKVEVTMLAGAAAGIAAIFRAPLTGAIMGIESPYRKDLAHEALIHGLVASAASYATFTLLRNNHPYFPILFHYQLNVRDLFLCLPVGLAAGLLSRAFLLTLMRFKRLAQHMSSRFLVPWIVGGVLLAMIALLMIKIVGDPATLQSGHPVANRLLAGQYTAAACLVILIGKLIATAITFGMGGVGGLFLPSATIGAALGALCDIILAPSQPGLLTLVGIAAFTGASYNSLLFSAVFIAEASGNPALVVPGLIASSFAYLASAGASNSPSQKLKRGH